MNTSLTQITRNIWKLAIQTFTFGETLQIIKAVKKQQTCSMFHDNACCRLIYHERKVMKPWNYFKQIFCQRSVMRTMDDQCHNLIMFKWCQICLFVHINATKHEQKAFVFKITAANFLEIIQIIASECLNYLKSETYHQFNILRSISLMQ